MKKLIFIYVSIFMRLMFPIWSHAAETTSDTSKISKRASFTEAIEDNSFYIEEAYNQERRVVQHISNGVYFSKPQRDFTYSFTQEWPLFYQTHQLSFTIPYAFLNSNAVSGIGDLLINYRYQLFTNEAWAAVSPRLSVIIPSGDADKGLGSGSTGVQFNLPLSKRFSESFITHFNAGLTVMFNVEVAGNAGKSKKNLTSYHIGASVIWLAKRNYNFLLEYLTNFSGDFDDNGDVVHNTETIISPGFRYALDIGNLQVVPGVGVPLSLSDGESRIGMFFYLSLEHPF